MTELNPAKFDRVPWKIVQNVIELIKNEFSLAAHQQAQCIIQPSLQRVTNVHSDKVPYLQTLPYSDILRYCIAF